MSDIIRDGRRLFLSRRYEDAVYIWKQALLLDVSQIYSKEIQELIDQAKIEENKAEESRLSRFSNLKQEELLLDVTRSSIASKKEGSPRWALQSRDKKESRDSLKNSSKKKLIWKQLNKTYTLNFKDASLKGVVDLLTDLTGLSIVIDTKEIDSSSLNQNNITFKVSDMPLIKIIKAILRFTNFDYLIEDGLIWVTTKEKIRKEDISLDVYDIQDLIGKVFDFPGKNLGNIFSKTDGG